MRACLWAVALAAPLVRPAAGVDSCPNACRPWEAKGKACDAGGFMDFRIATGFLDGDGDPACAADVRAANCGTNDYPKNNANPLERCDGTKEGCTGYKSHFYCAEVDQFSSFKLTDSYNYLTQSAEGKAVTEFDIFTYGSGPFHTVMPEAQQSGRVPVYQAGVEACDGRPAVASFLIYNVTLVDGRYKYRNNQPIGNGFMNTCDSEGKSCMFGGDVCIGNTTAGVSNCARCLPDPSAPQPADGDEKPAPPDDIKVLVTFYGSNADGRALLSGSSNPLNFRQFASGDSAINSFKDLEF